MEYPSLIDCWIGKRVGSWIDARRGKHGRGIPLPQHPVAPLLPHPDIAPVEDNAEAWQRGASLLIIPTPHTAACIKVPPLQPLVTSAQPYCAW